MPKPAPADRGACSLDRASRDHARRMRGGVRPTPDLLPVACPRCTRTRDGGHRPSLRTRSTPSRNRRAGPQWPRAYRVGSGASLQPNTPGTETDHCVPLARAQGNVRHAARPEPSRMPPTPRSHRSCAPLATEERIHVHGQRLSQEGERFGRGCAEALGIPEPGDGNARSGREHLLRETTALAKRDKALSEPGNRPFASADEHAHNVHSPGRLRRESEVGKSVGLANRRDFGAFPTKVGGRRWVGGASVGGRRLLGPRLTPLLDGSHQLGLNLRALPRSREVLRVVAICHDTSLLCEPTHGRRVTDHRPPEFNDEGPEPVDSLDGGVIRRIGSGSACPVHRRQLSGNRKVLRPGPRQED